MRSILLRRRRVVVIAVAAVGLAVIAVILIVGGGDGQGSADTTGAEASTNPAGSVPAAASGPVADLSTEELADQVILAGFDGSDPGSDVVGDVAHHQLGGILFEASNWDGAKAGRKLIAAIREASSKDDAIPLLIAVAQEGGFYRALSDLPPELREVEIGDRGDTGKAAEWMKDSAKALHDAGFDLDLAPVADVATLSSPVADRAFSDDSVVAAQMTAAAVKACEKSGIACAPAHFPGLGAASQDTDAGPASVGLDAGTIQQFDLAPFIAAFKAGAPATVVSNAFYTAYDPVTPGSLNPSIATDLLRSAAKFKGVAISDDLSGGAIAATSSPGDAAARALAAGIDLLQVSDPDEIDEVRKAIGAALEEGTLSEERLREAAGRVLMLKKSLG